MTRRAQDAPWSVSDDGRSVVIDVHGCGARTALDLVTELVTLAARRGRAEVQVIHGLDGAISALVTAALDRRDLDVSGHVRLGGKTLLSLGVSGTVDDRRISASDLR